MGHKRTRPKPQRLSMAKNWLPTYSGTKIVKGYKKKFAVDSMTAIRDLLELGVPLEPSYIEALKKGEEQRLKQLNEKKQEKLIEQHDLEDIYEEMGVWDYVYDGYNDEIDITNNHQEPERSRAAFTPVLPKVKLLSVNFENRIGIVKKAGKNHVKVNGTLLQTNKKWSQLKQKQREWIYELVRTEHKKFIDEHGCIPMKTDKMKLIIAIETKIDERGIWLPSHELEQGIGKYIDKLNSKA